LLHKIFDVLVEFGPLGVFLLAILDSVGVPLPGGTDVLMFIVAVKSPSQAYWTAAIAIIGSLIGNTTLFWGARGGGNRFIKTVPAPGKPGRFREWFARYGMVTVFVPALLPFPPLPLKVFVISAALLRTPFREFLAVVFVARVIRYGGEAYLGVQLGENGAQAYLRNNAFALVGVALALALALVLLIKLNDRRKPVM
jgi:membrane protein DedA with SNARE-associated domain